VSRPESFGAFLARDLRYFPGREKLVAAFEAYFDHSYTGDGRSRVLTLGAVVATATRWERFSLAWKAAMKRGGADGKILHMADLMAGGGQFPGWTIVEQTNLLRKLVPVVRSHIGWGYAASIPVTDFEEMEGFHERSDPRKSMRPIGLAFQAMLQDMVVCAKPAPDRPLYCYMEEDQLVEHYVTEQFHFIRSLRGWRDIVTLIRALPKGPAPLQAADMLAYAQGRHVSHHVFGTSPLPPAILYTELKRCRKIFFCHIGRDSLAQHAANVAHVVDLARDDPQINAQIIGRFAAAEKETQRERSALGRDRKRLRRERNK
jgi:hypothetical protein